MPSGFLQNVVKYISELEREGYSGKDLSYVIEDMFKREFFFLISYKSTLEVNESMLPHELKVRYRECFASSTRNQIAWKKLRDTDAIQELSSKNYQHSSFLHSASMFSSITSILTTNGQLSSQKL